jgi:hypothetical protein
MSRSETPSGVALDARPDAPGRSAAPAATPSAPANVADAVLLVTEAADEGGAAALLPLDGDTPLARLAGQLVALGAQRVEVLAREPYRDAAAEALAGLGAEVRVRSSAGVREDALAVAELARAGAGGVVVAQGEVVASDGALAGLLDDPRIATGVLGRNVPPADPAVVPFRGARGRVLSTGSAYHEVDRPTGSFLGALKVGARDRDALAAAAERLAELLAPPLPDDWAAAAGRGAPGEDAATLLAVALVRTGTHVTNTDVRAFHWSRPRSPADAERAARELAAVDEDRLRLDSAVKATDGFFTTFFVSPYSKHMARWAARRGLTPNQVTTVSMGIGVAAAAAFATGERAWMVAGAVLLQLAFATDCVDGQLARYTRRFSTLGAWLDSVFDRGKEYVAFAGLAIGSARGFDDDVWTLAAAALMLQTVRHAFDFSFNAMDQQAVASAPTPPLERTSDADPTAAPAPQPKAPAAEPVPAGPRSPVRRLAATVLGWSRVLDAVSWSIWIKKMIVFPIGERFAVMSILAAVATPRAVFVTILAWGGVGATYALAGRFMRSALRPAASVERAATFLRTYRDDGLLATAVGRALGLRTPTGRLAWLVPGIVRAVEYGTLLALALASDEHAVPACFALLGALAFRHYDAVYRLRFQGVPPARWVRLAGLGWDGRLILAGAALAAGALAPVLYAAAIAIAAASAIDSAASWRRHARSDDPAAYGDDDEED